MLQGLVDVVVSGILNIVLLDSAAKIDCCYYLQFPDYLYSKQSLHNLPECADGFQRVVIVSDTHECHWRLPQLPQCHTLIHCGDILMTSKYFSYPLARRKLEDFNNWLKSCPADQRIVIAGNHDHFMEFLGKDEVQSILTGGAYLVNECANLNNLTAWATPLSVGRSPNKAFQSKDFRKHTMLSKPTEVDILITHGQCEELTSSIKHKIHIWGHSHNSYGIRYPGDSLLIQKSPVPVTTLSICVPIMNGRFQMRNLPVVTDLPKSSEELHSIPTAEQVREHAFTYVPSTSSKLVGNLRGMMPSNYAAIKRRKPEARALTSPQEGFFYRLLKTKVVPLNEVAAAEKYAH